MSGHDVHAPRREAVLLFFLLLILSLRHLASSLHDVLPILYQAATLSFNYVEFGAVRRGLGSTLVYLLHPDRLVATALFHLISATFVCGLVGILYARAQLPPLARATFILISVSLMRRWAVDAGRADLAVAGLIAAAVLCLDKGRLVAAVGLVTVGLFVHETSVIVGIPLLLALLLACPAGAATISRRSWVMTAGLLLAAGLLYASLDRLPRADQATMVRTVQAALPPHKYVDWAIYFATSQGRGLRASICQNLNDPNYALHVGSGLLIVLLTVFALCGRQGRTPWLALLASVPGYLFLCAVANDLSRWAVFGAFAVWLFAASRAAQQHAVRRELPWLRLAVAAAVVPLVHMGRIPVAFAIYTPSAVVEYVSVRLGGPRTQSLDEALRLCDPNWREVLGAADAPGTVSRPGE